MGGGSGGGTSTNTIQKSDPWGPQQGYIQNAFTRADQIYNDAKDAGPFKGEMTAGPNDYQTAAEQTGSNYAKGLGSELNNNVGNSAAALVNNATDPYLNTARFIGQNGISGNVYGGNYNVMMDTLNRFGTGAQTTAGPDSRLSGALNQSAISGARALQGFQGGLQGAAGNAATDPTGRVVADASTYANNPAVQAQMSAVNNQIDQTLHEQTLPGLNREAAMGGGLNSSRAGMAEAMANEGAGIAKGNADASIMGNAWNQGLNTASNQWATGLNSSVNANLGGMYASGSQANQTAAQQTALNEFNTGTQLGAANTGLGTSLGYMSSDANAMMGANAQLGNAINMGYNGAQASGNLAAGDASLLSNAGSLQQQGQQATDTNALQQWNMQNQFQQGLLNNYWNIVGQPAGTATSVAGTTQNSGPGVMASVAGLGMGAAGLNQAFPGLFSSIGNAAGSLFGSGAGLTAAASGAGLMFPTAAGAAASAAAGSSLGTLGAGFATDAAITGGAGAAAAGAGGIGAAAAEAAPLLFAL